MSISSCWIEDEKEERSYLKASSKGAFPQGLPEKSAEERRREGGGASYLSSTAKKLRDSFRGKKWKWSHVVGFENFKSGAYHSFPMVWTLENTLQAPLLCFPRTKTLHRMVSCVQSASSNHFSLFFPATQGHPNISAGKHEHSPLFAATIKKIGKIRRKRNGI